MVRLVGDLLDSSAIEAGILRIHPDWCDLPLVLEAAVSCLPPEASQQVELRCDDRLSPIWADHDRLEQLFLNLIENAIRHTPPGTHVCVEAAPAGPADNPSQVVIRVIDDGPGIPPEVAQRMFQPHERGATASPGAGLGLTIANGIVDAHRGRLNWQATPAGTCFEISLPTDPPDEHK
jgi:signal transduction histidine kinase